MPVKFQRDRKNKHESSSFKIWRNHKILHFSSQIVNDLIEYFSKIHMPNWQFCLPAIGTLDVRHCCCSVNSATSELKRLNPPHISALDSEFESVYQFCPYPTLTHPPLLRNQQIQMCTQHRLKTHQQYFPQENKERRPRLIARTGSCSSTSKLPDTRWGLGACKKNRRWN